ncbi:MAG: hypothetical protein ACRCX2_05185 [Paraclostridium sp.]
MNSEIFYKCFKFIAYTVYTAAIALVVNAWFFGNLIKNIKF